jgi:hypothetical protein
MNFDTCEVAVIEQAATRETENQLVELNQLQLALVGGGIGDPLAA